ncbi:hypothetical protein HID58_074649, partial [Brassica napus]
VYEFPVVRLFLMMLYAVLELHLIGLSQSLVDFYVVFFVVGLPSIVSARLCFQDLVFGDLTFILVFSLCSLILLHFSSPVASLVALQFAMFDTPGLDSVFFRSFVVLHWHGRL